MGSDESFIEHRTYARVGLLGNPSDVYFGRTISFSLRNFSASVRLEPSDDLVIRPHPHHDLVSFASISHLVTPFKIVPEQIHKLQRKSLSITLRRKRKTRSCQMQDNEIELKEGNFTLSYDTDIPRQTEKELGIVAGLQDRVAQVYGGLVYMDFRKEHMEKMGHGMYIPMDTTLLPSLHLIYAENPSDSGKVHSTVHKRWLDGDKFIVSSMEEVAKVALEGRKALLEKDYSKLAQLMNHNFDLRRQMFGDEVLGSLNIKMIEVARSVGAASKFTGSGGAIIAFCPEGPDQVKLLEDACQEAGIIMQPVEVVPSVLTEEDLKTLPKLGALHSDISE